MTILFKKIIFLVFAACLFGPGLAQAQEADVEAKAYAVYGNNALVFLRSATTPAVGDTCAYTTDVGTEASITIATVYEGVETDTYSEYSKAPWYKDGSYSNIKTVAFNDTIAPVSTAYWFFGMSGLTGIDQIAKLDTTRVTTMNSMFRSAPNLISLDLRTFNTSNVTDMNSMFKSCTNLTTLNISSFNTSNLTNIEYMFSACPGLTTLDLSNFNTEKITSMSYLFSGSRGLETLNLSSFDTSNVTSMVNMFSSCYQLTSLDLSNFNTANVTNMNNMFLKCSSLTAIYIGDGWSTDKVTSSTEMFSQCSVLVGGAGTACDGTTNIDATYACVDGGTDTPGYLTYKTQEDDPGTSTDPGDGSGTEPGDESGGSDDSGDDSGSESGDDPDNPDDPGEEPDNPDDPGDEPDEPEEPSDNPGSETGDTPPTPSYPIYWPDPEPYEPEPEPVEPSEEPTEPSSGLVVVDEGVTGVTVDPESELEVDDGLDVKLVVEPILEESDEHKAIASSVCETSQLAGVYDASLYINNTKVSDGFGSITLVFPVGEEWNGRNVRVWHIHDGGEPEFQYSVVKDGKVTVTTTRFSVFAVEILSEPVVDTQVIYRLYNPNTGEHFFTANSTEHDMLVNLGWDAEGEAWKAPETGIAVYRLYNPNAGEHFFTTSEVEKAMLLNVGWQDEGIGWYSDVNRGVPVYRLYNPNAFANNHHYTTDASERDLLISLGWMAEGIGWYGVKQ